MRLCPKGVVVGLGQSTFEGSRSRFCIACREQGTPLVVQGSRGSFFVDGSLPKLRGGIFKLVGPKGIGTFDQLGLGVRLRVQDLGGKQHQPKDGQDRP